MLMIAKKYASFLGSFILGFFIMFLIHLLYAHEWSVQRDRDIKSVKQETSVGPTTRPLTQNEILILADKAKKMSGYEKQLVTFGSRTVSQNGNVTTIDLLIKGPEKTLMDAADIRLDFSQGIEVLQVEKGKAFSSYPHISVRGASILATGIADISDGQISYGLMNSTFIRVTLRQFEKTGTVKIISEGTNVYLMGESILDRTKSIDKLL